MAHLGAASRMVTIALIVIVIGLVLLAIGIAYLTVPAYGLPSFLPHEESSIDPSVKQGRAAIIAAVLCFLGAWRVRTAGR
jgi:hypothetical protein